MLKYLLLFFLFFSVLINAYSQDTLQDDVTGIWKGELTQGKGGYLSNYWFEIEVQFQEDSIVKGVTRIGDFNDKNVRGQFAFVGIFKDNQFAFKEHKMLEEKITKGYGWCYKVGLLNLTKEASRWQLEGEWQGKRFGVCSPGRIKIFLPKSSQLILKLKAKDSFTKKTITPDFQCFDKNNKLIPPLENTNLKMTFELDVHQNYRLKFHKKGYYPYSSLLYFEEYKTIQKEILLNPIRVDDVVQIESVYFKQSKAKLLDGSKATLDDWVDFLKENPSLKIEVRGHTDNVGNVYLNQKLSLDRAKKIYTYFVKNGIDKDRLTYQGFGGTKPVASNQTETGRQKNRRVEFRILEN